MPLTFDDRGLLVPGIQDATIVEIDSHFARMQRSDRRIQLFKKFQDWYATLQKAGWGCSVILDGSFVMPPVDEPGDIDVILILPESWDLTADLRPSHYNLVSRKLTKRAYEIEVYPVLPNSVEYENMLALFLQVRVEWCRLFGWPVDSLKGLVRIVP